ncbi:MAG: hypothetical protein IJM57_05400 [Lachnospiraceae bacterium]|nr:hypothetical protein [Lachnospiraceae bacterium]
MGRLIYCIGDKAKIPFYFQSTGVCVYTMEELCYYLYHNVETMEEDISESQLVPWIRMELNMPERADFLATLMERKSGIKDMVVSIFCSTDYYSQDEINALIEKIDKYIELLPIERKKRHATAILKYGKRREALLEYQTILDDRDFSQLSEEEQGTTYHNLAVLMAQNGQFRSAARYFQTAYQKSGDRESLCQYLYALKLGGKEEEFERELTVYSDDTDVVRRIENQFYFLEENREYSPDYVNYLHLMELKESGETGEEAFWWLFNETVERLKESYRDR